MITRPFHAANERDVVLVITQDNQVESIKLKNVLELHDHPLQSDWAEVVFIQQGGWMVNLVVQESPEGLMRRGLKLMEVMREGPVEWIDRYFAPPFPDHLQSSKRNTSG